MNKFKSEEPDNIGSKRNKKGKKEKKPDMLDSLPADSSEVNTPLNKELLNILNEKIYSILKEDQKGSIDKNKINEELQQLQGILKEYLDTYLVLGYTFNGTPFLLSNAPTERDHNALVEHLRITYMNTFKNSLF